MQVPHLRHLSLDLPPCLGELTPVKQDTLTVELKSTAEAEEARIARPSPAEKTQLPDNFSISPSALRTARPRGSGTNT